MTNTAYGVNRKWKMATVGVAIVYLLLSPLAVRGHAAVSLGSLTFNGVFPRIFTPNSDGFNDKALFHFDNPELLPVTGKVYDISGAEVAPLAVGNDPATLLMWDGKDESGRLVPGGIYLYQIDFQGKFVTGTVVVAR